MLGRRYRWCPNGCGKKVCFRCKNDEKGFYCIKCGKKVNKEDIVW